MIKILKHLVLNKMKLTGWSQKIEDPNEAPG